MDNNARRLQSLVEALDDVILELDESSVIKQVWTKDKAKLFMPPEYFIDKSITEVFGEYGNIFIECIAKLLKTGKRQECIYPDFDPGREAWYCAKFQKIDSNDTGTRIICVIEDITAKKNMSDQLQQNTLELKRLNNLLEIGLDISKMGGWEYNITNDELYLTKQIYDIKEDQPTKISYTDALNSFDKYNRAKLLQAIKNSLIKNAFFDIELEFISAKNNKKWVRFSGIPVIENQKISMFRGVLKDITSRKNSELELIEAKNLAEQIARKRTETLSIMSHEIRTPLNAIIGISNLLNQANFPNKEIGTYINHLKHSSNHLLHLINDILDLEKMESKKMELNETVTDLVSLVNNAYKQFLPLAKAKGLVISFRHDHAVPKSLMVDDLRLRRILNNLIGNAIKFTEKGEINIELETVHIKNETASILFKITDTGIGIPEHLHNLVFDKFHQVQQDTHREQEGSGLGLNITKGLIKLFNSEIKLKSRSGHGSVFEFQIDFKCLDPIHSVDKKDLPDLDFFSLPAFKLLIVDDNVINLLVASRQLNRFGIKAQQAESAKAALGMLENEAFDVMLIDLHMPGMDGYELVQIVQQQYPSVKIIIFTADVLEEVRVRLKKMNIDHILSKPFKPEEMYQLLLTVLREK